MLDENFFSISFSQFQSQLSAIETLVGLNGSGAYLNRLVESSIQSLLEKPDLKGVSKENVEIMSLPEGELYDKSLIESAVKLIQEAALGSANQKKESKTYSYKEQLADAELRKELEKKKRKELENKRYTIDEIRTKMSKKQQEMLDAQIVRERAIREEMLAKDEIVKKAASVLISVIRGNPEEAKAHTAFIVNSLTQFLRSPLCIGYIAQVFEAIADTFVKRMKNSHGILYSDSFLHAIINCTLRLTSTPFSVEKRWTQESMGGAFKRLCQLARDSIAQEIERDNFDVSVFSLFYPFFKVSICGQKKIFFL